MPTKLGGIIYPKGYHISDLLKGMSIVYGDALRSFRYKNFEMGMWGDTQAPRKSLSVILDGRITNAEALQAELKKMGYAFKSDCESELLSYLYDAWGEEFIGKLQGDFALAFFDQSEETLFLVRDRLGKKRLYWCQIGAYWLFASDIKALLSTGLVPQTPGMEGLSSYFYFGYIPQDLSPIKGVNKVLPGYYVKVNLKGSFFIHQYWSYSQLLKKQKPIRSEECKEKVHEIIRSSTESAQNSCGVFVKKNLSSAILSCYLQPFKTNLLSFSYGDPENPLAQAFDEKHCSTSLTPAEVLRDLPKMIWALDEPIADPEFTEVWSLSSLAKSKGCRQIYSTLGFEQIFACSQRFLSLSPSEYKSTSPSPLAKLPRFLLNRMLFPFLKLFNMDIKYEFLRNSGVNARQKSFLLSQALFQPRSFKKASPFLFKYFDPDVFIQRFHKLSSICDIKEAILYFEAKTLLPDLLLASREEILSTHGIEIATPFLSDALVTFMAELPPDLKFDPNFMKSILHKLLLENCPHFPIDTINASQLSYLELWRKNKDFRTVFALLAKGNLVEEGLLSAKWVKKQLDYPYLIPSAFRELFALLVLEIWYRLFITKPFKCTEEIKETTEELLRL